MKYKLRQLRAKLRLLEEYNWINSIPFSNEERQLENSIKELETRMRAKKVRYV